MLSQGIVSDAKPSIVESDSLYAEKLSRPRISKSHAS
jgi:hypothetical protein